MYHTKFHENRIITEHFKIVGRGTNICDNFQFCPNLN